MRWDNFSRRRSVLNMWLALRPPSTLKTNNLLLMLTPCHFWFVSTSPKRGSLCSLELQFSQTHLSSPPLSSQSNVHSEVFVWLRRRLHVVDLFHTEIDAEGGRQGRWAAAGVWTEMGLDVDSAMCCFALKLLSLICLNSSAISALSVPHQSVDKIDKDSEVF